jgi:hypothetical protein
LGIGVCRFGWIERELTELCTTQLARRHRCPDAAGPPAHFFGRHLPQGAPTSPALANLIAYRMDLRLASWAAASGAAYTRYADDFAFSGGSEFARARHRFRRTVFQVIVEEGFRCNIGKSRWMTRGGRQHLAGVVINEKPNVIRAEFDQLKAILTNCVRLGPANQNRAGHPDFRSHLRGRIAHVASLNLARAEKLMAIFRQIDWRTCPAG